jgi:hypothetical protein
MNDMDDLINRPFFLVCVEADTRRATPLGCRGSGQAERSDVIDAVQLPSGE